MKEPIIYDEDENIDDLLLGEANILEYRGIRFTGTLVYNDTKPVSYTEFKNGRQDGKDVTYYRNGQLEKTALYAKGKCIKWKKWYANGQLKDSSENNLVTFDKDGTLIKNNGWVYKNGAKRVVYIDGVTKHFYSSEGELMIEVVIKNSKPFVNTTRFFHSVLFDKFDHLLDNIYLHSGENVLFRNEVQFEIVSWALKVNQKKGEDKAIEILKKVITTSENRLSIINEKNDLKKMEFSFISHCKNVIERLQRGEFSKANLGDPDKYSQITY